MELKLNINFCKVKHMNAEKQHSEKFQFSLPDMDNEENGSSTPSTKSNL